MGINEESERRRLLKWCAAWKEVAKRWLRRARAAGAWAKQNVKELTEQRNQYLERAIVAEDKVRDLMAEKKRLQDEVDSCREEIHALNREATY